MPTEEGHGTPPGILAAMKFPNALVETVLRGYSITESEAKILGGIAWKFFGTTGNTEGIAVRHAVYNACRIEGAIGVGPHETIALTLSCYTKGKKEAFFFMRLYFNLVHGTIHSLGGRSEVTELKLLKKEK